MSTARTAVKVVRALASMSLTQILAVVIVALIADEVMTRKTRRRSQRLADAVLRRHLDQTAAHCTVCGGWAPEVVCLECCEMAS